METNVLWKLGSDMVFEIRYLPSTLTVGDINFEIGEEGSRLRFQLPLHKAKALLDSLAGNVALADAEFSQRKGRE